MAEHELTFGMVRDAMKVVELFAGVGGFRAGLERAGGFDTVWFNQWEPGRGIQHAHDCYLRHFGPPRTSSQLTNVDIASVPAKAIPRHDLLVGGFPCQDYSVQTTLDKSRGIQGKKGVLWWEIHRIISHHRPKYVLLENVDRLLRSPARQRGRDFAIMLSCLANLGYHVEWRILNAADHGLPQRRRRVFILAARGSTRLGRHMAKNAASQDYLSKTGFFAQEFSVRPDLLSSNLLPASFVEIDSDPAKVSSSFEFRFENAGVMVGHRVWTRRLDSKRDSVVPLHTVLEPNAPAHLEIGPGRTDWEREKGSKQVKRTARNGFTYLYSEGALSFPDPLDRPARTLLTSEGSRSPNRTTHVILDPFSGKLRLLTPRECERLMDFEAGWTEGMPDRWRYFTMGNALVVGLVARVGRQLQNWGRVAKKPALKVEAKSRRRPSKP